MRASGYAGPKILSDFSQKEGEDRRIIYAASFQLKDAHGVRSSLSVKPE
ncbi:MULTISPECIES: hypothetical protein [Dissulfurimicrobium]|nr:hypothetical protein [Dissulfurimicrobium hydrothermale]UKL13800.1 hypothetical protein LGS26_00515 [Dissulfurimicrobium hydrothermale]UKL13838.1 hypothetical protein LGS26_00750 [Dissulfurimicrobium hydrothermale]UKL13919.1 hypothetical protein LGS26_01250 [Dissulfurimicrobium hydrothermale]